MPFTVALLMMMLLVGCRDKEFEEATIEVLRPAEYAASSTTPIEYVRCSSENVSLSSEDELDTTQVGMHTAKLKLEKGRNSRTEEVEIPVTDTTPPRIELKEGEVSIEMGEDLDPAQIVAKVSDPVDGNLDYVLDKPKPKGKLVGEEVFYDTGWYLVSADTDLTKLGTHDVAVTAEDKHGNEASAVAKVRVTDPLEGVTLNPSTSVLEYSKKSTDPVKLVTCSVEGAKVTANELELNKVGKVTVEYTIAKGASTHTEKVDFEVRDTKSPVITLGSNEVAVDHGASFDPYKNVKSVKDDVDGDLVRVDKEPSENGDGWYTVTGSWDTSAPSKYFLTVVACDRNGNRTTKEYSLVVNEPPQEAEPSVTASPSTAVDNARDYVLNTNTHKFHYPGCRDIGKMKAKNRQDVHMTRDEVIGMGYSSCGHCNP